MSDDASLVGGRDLEVHGEGFDDHDGQQVRLAIYNNGEFYAVAEQEIVQGTFQFTVPRAAGDYSTFALSVDQDNDDACDDGEPTWSFTTGPNGCSSRPCPNDDGVVVEYVRLPLEECADCNPWMPHPLTTIGLDVHCSLGVGGDLAQPLSCPL